MNRQIIGVNYYNGVPDFRYQSYQFNHRSRLVVQQGHDVFYLWFKGVVFISLDVQYTTLLSHKTSYKYYLRNIHCKDKSTNDNSFESSYVGGILPKGPYPPCLRMADRALLAGYPRCVWYGAGTGGVDITSSAFSLTAFTAVCRLLW